MTPVSLLFQLCLESGHLQQYSILLYTHVCIVDSHLHQVIITCVSNKTNIVSCWKRTSVCSWNMPFTRALFSLVSLDVSRCSNSRDENTESQFGQLTGSKRPTGDTSYSTCSQTKHQLHVAVLVNMRYLTCRKALLNTWQLLHLLLQQHQIFLKMDDFLLACVQLPLQNLPPLLSYPQLNDGLFFVLIFLLEPPDLLLQNHW